MKMLRTLLSALLLLVALAHTTATASDALPQSQHKAGDSIIDPVWPPIWWPEG